MDLVYPHFGFRQYFDFIVKKRASKFVDIIMEDRTENLLHVIDSLRAKSSHKIQMSRCMTELADILSEASTEELRLLENGDLYFIVLEVMEKYFINRDVQFYGIFILYRLMEESREIRRNLLCSKIGDFVLKLMSHYKNEVVIQEIGCRILLMILEDGQVKQEINVERAIDVIAQTMRNFTQNEEVQLPALQAMKELIPEHEGDEKEVREKFVEHLNHILVLDTLENQIESGEVVEEALLLFSALAKSSSFGEQLLTSRFASVLLSGMEYHVNLSGVQCAALELLKSLPRNDGCYQDFFVQKNISSILLKTMESHKRSRTIQKDGIEVFSSLCKTLFQLSDNRTEVAQCWLNCLLVVMATHCDDPDTLIIASNAISTLGEHHPDMLVLVGEDYQGGIPLHTTIMAALALHIDNADVCQVVCKTIGCVAVNSVTIQQSLFNKGVYLYIIQAMQQHHVAGVQQYGFQSLRILCICEVENMKTIMQLGAWDLIAKSLADFTDDVGVQQEAIAIIALLLTDIEFLRPQCVTEHLYEKVLRCMDKFLDNARLIEISFEAIGVFSAYVVLADLMVGFGVVRTVLRAMNAHLTEITIQQKGCILIQVLSSYIKGEDCVDAVTSIIRAMQKFNKDECVQNESCVALRLIAQVDANNSEILVNQCVHERLFAILDQFNEEEKVIELASDVLWLLGCQRNFSSLMLLSACADGLIKGAHCLVQVGADVNAGEGTNTPLCAACKNKKEEMVRYLLTQGIGDVHTALNLCLEMEHHNIVGILLQKLGHDREAGVISWNGLNLGSLYPEWLFPALSGSAFGLTVETERWCNYLRRAENAFIQRFKVLEKLLDVTVINNILDRNIIISTVIADAQGNSDESSAYDADEAFLMGSDDYDELAESKILTEKAPLRVDSITGASFPYSSYDPRVVIALNVGDPILLPKRMLASTTGIQTYRKFSPLSRKSSLPSRKISTPPRKISPLSRKRSLPSRKVSPLSRKSSPPSRKISSLSRKISPLSRKISPPSRKISPPSNKRIAPSEERSEFSRNSPSSTRRRSYSMLDLNRVSKQASKNVRNSEDSRPLLNRRTFSDVGKNSVVPATPSFELPGLAFMYELTPRRRSGTKSEDFGVHEDQEEHLESGRKISSSRMQSRRATVYTAFPSANGASVRVIDVSGNRISDLNYLVDAGDSFLFHLKHIQRLELGKNELSSFPSALCKAMPLLQQVNLNHNNFEEFPFCFQQCKRLKELDLSYNKLKLLPPSPKCSSVLLESLSLANNSLKDFPEWLAEVFPGITKLSLAGNEIEILPSSSLKMPRLKILDLSRNKIEQIPNAFLLECKYLEYLNASFNELSTLPEIGTNSFTNLKTLRLAHNNLAQKEPLFLPRFILVLPNLKALDLSHNKLTHLPPPNKWTTKHLKELVLSHNNIKRIHLDSDVSNWKSLERLILSHNNLKGISKDIGALTSLLSLDLSHNPGISSLPDEMGRLSNLWDLQLTGIKLDLEGSLLGNTKNIIAFLNSKLLNSVPYYRMKLVTVGLAGRGKTTLLNQLIKSKAPPSQNELVIRDWLVRDSKAICRQCHHRSVIYTINTWDFKGKEDLYQVYQGLMSSRTLYLVVYNVVRGGQELEDLRPLLQSIHASAPDVPVMLVGSHLDKIPKEKYDQVLEEMKERSSSLFLSPGLPEIKAHVVLNCTQESSGIQTLRNKIVDLVFKCKCKGLPILGSCVPQKFVRLQSLILREVRAFGDRMPFLKLTDLKKLLIENEMILSEGELGQAVKFMHEAGVLVHYDDPVAHLNHLFFVQPEWLCHVISSVVTVRDHNWMTNGVVSRKELVSWTKDETSTVKIPYDLLPQFLRILERFGVLLPISDSEFLMAPRLQPLPTTVELPDLTRLDTYYRRLYQFAYVPLGFWPRLITRLLLFIPEMRPKEDEEEACLESPSIDYWCDGIQVSWSTQSYFSVYQDPSAQFGSNVLAIVVPLNVGGVCFLGVLVDHVDTLIEEWFPGLCCIDPIQGTTLVHRLCPCIKCENSHVFTLDECIEKALRFEEIACPRTSELLPVERIAPDVALADLRHKELIVGEKELLLEVKKDFVLGDGGFGTVFKAKYGDKWVAVKVFHSEGDVNPHRLLRQEVSFLARLHHPSIITLLGVSVEPRALILECAPLASLSSLLNKGEVLSRGLQHRIALQIAEGLAYLHHHKIVYRDLKPHNVLIFSLSLTIVINAKISDFGIARYATLYGLKSSEGTPGYRAPEVARGDVGYNKEADMYSFGMFLYELVTGGRRPFEDLRFRSELDAAVMQGRMVDPITDYGCAPWPDVDDLIQHLLEPRADMRPTADQAFRRLSRADLLCLRRGIPVCKEQSVECMAVRHYVEDNQDKMEVWMGSGLCDNNSGLVSWVNLTDRENEGCQGTGIQDTRVKCMTVVREDHVLVGTQSGNIWVFDAWSHKCLQALQPLSDAVVALRHCSNDNYKEDLVIAGLADGKLVIYQTKDLMNTLAPRQVIQLCKKVEDGGQCTEDCTGHSIACLAITQRSIFCGCGNDIVVLKIADKVEFKRRWSTEDRRRGLVRNIAVGRSYIWTSTKDSPIIDYWDATEPILRGSIDCKAIMNDYRSQSRGIRVVSMILDGQNALWVGLGTGHVILLSPTTRETICILDRHTASVRCMAIARGPTFGRPLSLIMTGGMGFVQRPMCTDGKTTGEFGHVLVWEADLGEQVRRLVADHQKRHQEPRR